MNTYGPFTRMITRMTMYGTAVSALGGFAFCLALFGFPYDTVESPMSTFLWASLFGTGFGFLYGIFASLTIGVLMVLMTVLFFRKVSRPRLFKLAMGVITAVSMCVFSPNNIVSYFVLCLLGRESFDDFAGPFAILAVVLVLAIYVSQIVARQHIAKISPIKRKVNE